MKIEIEKNKFEFINRKIKKKINKLYLKLNLIF